MSSRKQKQVGAAAAVPPAAAAEPVIVALRLGAGTYAIRAGEAEIRLDGARIAGGEGAFEFDLARECWVDIVLVRP